MLVSGTADAAFGSYLRTKYDPWVKAAALRHGLEPALIHAVILAESAYNRWAVSEAGAQGLMQLMPGTAAFYGVKDPFEPEQNIDGGVKYLGDLTRLYGGKTDLILAAYNAGQSAVKKYNGIPPYAQTRAYIETVKLSYARARAAKKTQVFRVVDAEGRTILTNDLGYARRRAR